MIQELLLRLPNDYDLGEYLSKLNITLAKEYPNYRELGEAFRKKYSK